LIEKEKKVENKNKNTNR